MSDDRIYQTEDGSEPFRFNRNVARVFPDMLHRSIPGYAASIEAIGSLAARYVRAGSNCYDLGCSLGAATLAMRQGIAHPACRIVAVDSAPAMIERCREIVDEDDRLNGRETQVDIVQADIRDIEIVNASMVVLNFTLQFLDLDDREAMVRRIYDGLAEGPRMEDLLTELHHEYKRRNHYSALEIARKRAALEDVLIPETVSAHRERLARAGFSNSGVWLRYFNFVSIVALR
jgi:tRNA (cmo5U34)-methyltransferase